MGDQTAIKIASEIGLTSYAFRYAQEAGQGCRSLVEAAADMGFRRVQLCENTEIACLRRPQLAELAELSADLGVVLELGIKGLSEESLDRHVEAAAALGCGTLRVVLSERKPENAEEQTALEERAFSILDSRRAALRDAEIIVGLENHFDLPTERLVYLADILGPGLVGLILDTSNCLGFLESPENALRLMGDRILSVHLKDYLVRKHPQGYSIVGAVLGQGQLDVSGFVASISALRSRPTILLELAVVPAPGMEPDAVLRWEREAVRMSKERLDSALR